MEPLASHEGLAGCSSETPVLRFFVHVRHSSLWHLAETLLVVDVEVAPCSRDLGALLHSGAWQEEQIGPARVHLPAKASFIPSLGLAPFSLGCTCRHLCSVPCFLAAWFPRGCVSVGVLGVCGFGVVDRALGRQPTGLWAVCGIGGCQCWREARRLLVVCARGKERSWSVRGAACCCQKTHVQGVQVSSGRVSSTRCLFC